MKFDIVRAWKDETYRQSLSAEQLQVLPSNPVGELTDTDLATISGAGGPFDGVGLGAGTGAGVGPGPAGFGVFGASQASFQEKRNFESLTGSDCECNWISMDTIKISSMSFVSLGSPITQICANTH